MQKQSYDIFPFSWRFLTFSYCQYPHTLAFPQGEICLLKSHLNFGSQVYTRHRLALTKWLLDLSPLQALLHEHSMYKHSFLVTVSPMQTLRF